MIRRTFWFVVGLVSGVYATLWVRRTAEEVSERLTPTALVDQVIHVLRSLVQAAISGVGFVVDTVGERNRTEHPVRETLTD